MKKSRPGLIVLMSFTLILISPTAFAKSFNAACPDLVSCIKAVSALTGEQYILDERELKGAGVVTSVSDLELTAENANLLLSTLLHSNSLSRVPNSNKMYVILRENEAKGAAVPVFQASATTTPEIPDTWDIMTLKYKCTYPQSAKYIENVLRTYVNMGARIYGVEHSGYLIITSTGKDLKTAMALARENDVKIDPAILKRDQARNHQRFEESLKTRPSSNQKSVAPTPTPAK